jgi:hypothetical protein
VSYDDYEYKPPERPGRSAHDQVVTSGAWWGTLAFTLAMIWVAAHVPWVVAWLANSAVTAGVSCAMARWKRAWYAWLAFWVIVAVSMLNGLLKAATPLLDSSWSAASWILAWIIVWAWYWLVRIPRRHPPAPGPVTHVVHHHVFHAPGAVQLPGAAPAAGGVPVWTAESLPGTAVPPAGIPGRARRAIESRARPGALAARIRNRAGRIPR